MRRLAISLIFVIFLMSLVSSEIIITQQPKEIYNLGEVISIPLAVKSLTGTAGILKIDLICNGISQTFYMNGISLSAGEEKRIDSQLILSRTMIGELMGDCKIKAILNEEYSLTNDFRISNSMTLTITSTQTEFEPLQNLFIKGNVAKESGAGASGFIEMQLLEGNDSTVSQIETIRDGFFMINTTLPAGMKAGAYLARLNAYEKDLDGLTTNSGTGNMNVNIKQVPSNLEIVFENSEVEPGTSVKIKTILHDQTGVSIPSSSFVTLKNNDNIIIEQSNKPTNEFYEFQIKYNEKPSGWTVVAVSNMLEAISNFTIKEKEAVDVQIINKTVVIKNMGNVPYNKTVLVNLGNESLNINVSLLVDEEKKYTLNAPNGEYNVEIKTAEGNSITGMVSLTGKEISVRESLGGFQEAIREPSVWMTIILILGFVAFLIFRKVRKKSFFGFIRSKKGKKEDSILDITEESLNAPRNNRAELSLSIKGEKQNASVVCIRIRNLREMKTKEDVRNTIKKIEGMANEQKAVEYESQDMIFFLLVPLRTKTFRNEESALKISQTAKEMLLDHNRLFKNKIDFGISLNYGDIIAKQEDILKFMSIGTLTTVSKKIALLSNENIMLSDKMNERVQRFAKTQRNVIDDFPVYTIREMKQEDRYKGFLDNFTKKYQEERENKE